MAEHYRFFDSANPLEPDRTYNAQEFTDYFKALVTTGVMKGTGNQLKVTTTGANMVSSIDTGIAFLLGRYYENDSLLALLHETEAIGKDRIDRIVIRMDLSTEARYVKAFIKKGVPGTVPVAPPLIQTANFYEIALAQVLIKGGQTYITTNAVTDERGKDVICPWAGSKILPNYDDAALEEILNAVGSVFESSAQKDIYLDSINGDDLTGDGSIIKPYKTFAQAFKGIRDINADINIKLKKGTYSIDTGVVNKDSGLPRTYKKVSGLSISGLETNIQDVTLSKVNIANLLIERELTFHSLSLANEVYLFDLVAPKLILHSIGLKAGRANPILSYGENGGFVNIKNITANNLPIAFILRGGVWTVSGIKGSGNGIVFEMYAGIATSDLSSNTVTGTTRVNKIEGAQFFES